MVGQPPPFAPPGSETLPTAPPRARTFSRRLVLAFAAALALLLLASAIDWRPARPASPPRRLGSAIGSGVLLAGVGKARVELPPDVPLAGFSPFGRAAESGASPLHVRALLLEVGGTRVAILLVELLTLPPSLAAGLRQRAKAAGAGCALVATTHTHAGPGGYDRAFLPQAAAIGRFDERVEYALLQAVQAALATARADLGAADLATTEARQLRLNFNRDRNGSPVDDLLTKLTFTRPDGAPVATLVRFAAHPTLTPRAVGPAGGWPATTMDELEEPGGVAFVLQGAVGDASADPSLIAPEAEGRDQAYGELVAQRVAALPAHEVQPPVVLGCSEVELSLPQPDLGAAVPRPLGRLVSNAAAPFAPAKSRVIALRLDDLVLLGVPAEPTRDAAFGAEAALALVGLRGRTVGLAQGYVGYSPLARDIEERVFSARMAWFGAELQPRLDAALALAAAGLAGPGGDGAVDPAPAPAAAVPVR